MQRPTSGCWRLRLILAACLVVSNATAGTIDPESMPLGNGKWSSTPTVGYVYACDPTHMYSITWTGVSVAGWWIHGDTWNSNEKPMVQGAVPWPSGYFSESVQGNTRTINTNALPIFHPSGTFPVSDQDPIYPFDRNGNSIAAQSISLSFPSTPTVQDQEGCVYDPVGVLTSGGILFAGLDSHDHDEPAYEMQDNCGGMSDPHNMYHLYRPNSCIPHVFEPNTLVGYALDGFGIYGPIAEDGNELTSADLDECHGITSWVPWDGKMVWMYHYVWTRDFPYTVSCFRGTPTYLKFSGPPANKTPPPPTNYALPTGLLDRYAYRPAAGVLSGWACDDDAPARPVTVFFYLDGTRDGGGTYITAVTANQPSPDVDSACGGTENHGFRAQIPAKMLNDGKTHFVTAYAVDINSGGWATGTYTMLPGSPRAATAFAPVWGKPTVPGE